VGVLLHKLNRLLKLGGRKGCCLIKGLKELCSHHHGLKNRKALEIPYRLLCFL
jgi:hypothetical protein